MSEASELADRLRGVDRRRARPGGDCGRSARSVRARAVERAARVREHRVADRVRADDLPAARRRADARAAAAANRRTACSTSGTGSGYHAALLARLAAHVWTIERHPELSAEAQRTIAALGIDNVEFFVGDGWRRPARARPVRCDQRRGGDGSIGHRRSSSGSLLCGGRLVAPVGATNQRLVLTVRTLRRARRTRFEPVRFVPLVRDGRISFDEFPGPGGSTCPAERSAARASRHRAETASPRPRPGFSSIRRTVGRADDRRRRACPSRRTGPRHQPPGREEAATIRRSTPSGFCVG